MNLFPLLKNTWFQKMYDLFAVDEDADASSGLAARSREYEQLVPGGPPNPDGERPLLWDCRVGRMRDMTSLRLIGKRLREKGENVTQEPLPERWVI